MGVAGRRLSKTIGAKMPEPLNKAFPVGRKSFAKWLKDAVKNWCEFLRYVPANIGDIRKDADFYDEIAADLPRKMRNLLKTSLMISVNTVQLGLDECVFNPLKPPRGIKDAVARYKRGDHGLRKNRAVPSTEAKKRKVQRRSFVKKNTITTKRKGKVRRLSESDVDDADDVIDDSSDVEMTAVKSLKKPKRKRKVKRTVESGGESETQTAAADSSSKKSKRKLKRVVRRKPKNVRAFNRRRKRIEKQFEMLRTAAIARGIGFEPWDSDRVSDVALSTEKCVAEAICEKCAMGEPFPHELSDRTLETMRNSKVAEARIAYINEHKGDPKLAEAMELKSTLAKKTKKTKKKSGRKLIKQPRDYRVQWQSDDKDRIEEAYKRGEYLEPIRGIDNHTYYPESYKAMYALGQHLANQVPKQFHFKQRKFGKTGPFAACENRLFSAIADVLVVCFI